MIVVVPPNAAARVPVSKSSDADVPPKGRSMCVCGSIPPGITSLPVASMVLSGVPAIPLRSFPMRATVEPSIRMSATYESTAVTTFPFLISIFIAANYTTPRHGNTKALGLQQCKTDDDMSELGRGMKTGQDVIEPGLYASECCGEEVFLERDASFPRCMKCKGLSQWEAVDVPAAEAA